MEAAAEAEASLSAIVFVAMTTVEIGCRPVAGFAEVDLAVGKLLVESLIRMGHLELLAGKPSHQPGLFQSVR